jgi:hypothetical protein
MKAHIPAKEIVYPQKVQNSYQQQPERYLTNKQVPPNIPPIYNQPMQQPVYNQPMQQQNAQQNAQPMVNLQVYPQQQPPQRKLIVPNTDPLQQQVLFSNPMTNSIYSMSPWQMVQEHVKHQPIINSYNISIDGVTSGHDRLSNIYEHVFVGQDKNLNGSSTIDERIDIHNYVKSILFPQGNAQDVGLGANKQNSLLEHIKFMDLNPYNNGKISKHPYIALPRDYLIYRSCFPIRHDMRTGTVTCAKNSMGSNVKIYKTVYGTIDQRSNKMNVLKYDEWREIKYYEYVKDHILKKKESPNFVLMHGYYISKNSNIDFDKLNRAGKKSVEPEKPDYVKTDGGRTIINPEKYLGEVLVAMTESPLYSLKLWATNTYMDKGNIKKQTSCGYFTNSVWKSVIFQLLAAMHCLAKHKIVLTDFTIDDNIFIRDLNMTGTVTQHWKYNINGFEYYVPNYGYSVMIDTNYKDIDSSLNLHKINAPFLAIDEPTDLSEKEKEQQKSKNTRNINYDEECFSMFQKSVDFTSLTNNIAFTNGGGVKPPDDIISTLNSIWEMTKTTKMTIDKYILTFMSEYLNNRIGTYLKEQEVVNVRNETMESVKVGSIVVHETANKTYQFVLVVGYETEKKTGDHFEDDIHASEDRVRIKTKKPNAKNLEDMIVNRAELREYSVVAPIMQNQKANGPSLNEDELLETYVCMNE